MKKAMKWVTLLLLGAALVGCQKKHEKAIPKNDPSLNDATPQTMVRTPGPVMEIGSALQAELDKLGVYTPDVCFQLVDISVNGVAKGQYFELGKTSCNYNAVIDDNDVVLRVKVDAPTNPGTVQIVPTDGSGAIGDYWRQFSWQNGRNTVKATLENLCTGGYEDVCLINVENSLITGIYY